VPDVQSIGRHVRVPASEIRHRFLRTEVGQLRGYPWLSGGSRRLWLLGDFEESAAVASSNAAKRQGFFVSPTGDAPPGFADTIVSSVLDAARAAGKVLTPDEIKSITAAAEKYATTVPGQFDTLPTGYDFRPFESEWPKVNADSYVKQQLRGWSAARGVSYVTLGNDLEGVNFSSARVGIVAEREHFKRLQGLLKRWLHTEVMTAILPYLVLATPGLSPDRLPAYATAITWQGRRWSGIDPVKEAAANETNLRLKLTSRRRIVLESGEDPDEIAAEVAREEQLYGEVQPAAAPAQPAADDPADPANPADATPDPAE
jgi:lambda family phage portal protein